MRNRLTEIIKQYLNIETNYAVIINGKYGIGKTYYFKNDLFPQIKEISLPKNNEKKYTPIHISLFGIKTIEDLQTQIFAGIYPILKKRSLKLAAGIGKSLIRGIAQINGLGNIDDFLNDIDLKPNEWINYDELVLCLDDLDRKSETLSIIETLGFINTLVENYGAKILIIANEKVLFEDEDYKSKLREKVIGVSIEFFPHTSHVYDLIIKERYESGNNLYYNFLVEHKGTIIGIVEKNENNLRNLIYFLEHFKIIYSSLVSQFQSDKDFVISKEEKLSTVLYFTLAVAMEYKTGHINSTNLYDLKNANILNYFNFDKPAKNLADNNEPVTESIASEFLEKYYGNNIEFIYFDSVFDYLTGRAPFVIEDLKRQLQKIYIVEEGNIPENQKILTKLGYFECLKLTSQEYKETTYKMLEFVDNGQFQLDQFPTVFHFATRFNNLLRFNINNLKKRFKKGILKGEYKYQYESHFRIRMSISEDTEFKDDVSEIVNFCVDINKKLEEKTQNNTLESLTQLLFTDVDKFIQSQYETNRQFMTNAFWDEIPITKVYQAINKMTNNEIIELAFYFKERYRRYIPSHLNPEKEFLKKLKEIINKPQRRNIKNLRNASLDILVKYIDDSILNFG